MKRRKIKARGVRPTSSIEISFAEVTLARRRREAIAHEKKLFETIAGFLANQVARYLVSSTLHLLTLHVDLFLFIT